jgi:hypothetical protein
MTWLRIAAGVVFVALVFVSGAAGDPGEGENAAGNASRERFRSAEQREFAIGAFSCSAVACHGEGRTGELLRELRAPDAQRNAHARARTTLYGEQSRLMVAILDPGSPVPAHERVDCMACHSSAGLGTQTGPAASRIRAEGVSCEACHGPASAWLDQHYLDPWRASSNARGPLATELTAARAGLGFVDLRSLRTRAERCLGCHLGDAGREVSHAMLAAGHPPLRFELARDLEGSPVHFRDEERAHVQGEDSAAFAVRQLFVGQAVELAQRARAVTRWQAARGQGANGQTERGDLAPFACASCHQGIQPTRIRTAQSRDTAGAGRGLPPGAQELTLGEAQAKKEGTTLGQPRLELSAFWLTLHAAQLIDGVEGAAPLEQACLELLGATTWGTADGERVRKAAARVADLADGFAIRLDRARFAPSANRVLLDRILKDADRFASGGSQAAEQAVAAVEVLAYRARLDPPVAAARASQVGPALERLRASVYRTGVPLDQRPTTRDRRGGTFDPGAFRAAMENVAQAVRAGN